jgi:hypothetical protein
VFDWEGYLRLAEVLNESTDNESCHRAAVSRAYYAAYNIARRYVAEQSSDEAKRKPFEDGGSHERVWNAFRKNTSGTRIEAAINKHGYDLLRDRVVADYRTHAKNNFRQTARSAISLAKAIITSINLLRKNQQLAPE